MEVRRIRKVEDLPPTYRALLSKLVERGKLPIFEVEAELSGYGRQVLSRLVELGFVKLYEDRVELTEAGIRALSSKELGPRVIVAISQEGRVEVHTASLATRRRLESNGYKCFEGYVLKGAEKPLRVEEKPLERVDEAWRLLREGKLRLAALRAYQLARKVGGGVQSRARRNLRSPTYRETASLLAELRSLLSKYRHYQYHS